LVSRSSLESIIVIYVELLYLNLRIEITNLIPSIWGGVQRKPVGVDRYELNSEHRRLQREGMCGMLSITATANFRIHYSLMFDHGCPFQVWQASELIWEQGK
jgi:hypothetical protein